MKRSLLISLVSFQLVSVTAVAAVSERDAVRAILGEASNQNQPTMLAIAGALRNRGHLRGVYGFNNPIIHQSTPALRARALKAWRDSARVDTSGGCRYFGCPSDAPYFRNLGYHPVKTVGTITFYQP